MHALLISKMSKLQNFHLHASQSKMQAFTNFANMLFLGKHAGLYLALWFACKFNEIQNKNAGLYAFQVDELRVARI